MIKLSPRIRQTLEMTLSGSTVSEMAGVMQVSENTLKQYKKRLYRYLGVHSKQELKTKICGNPVKIVLPTRLETYREYRTNGLTYKEIGRLEGVSPQHVKSYVQRNKGKHSL